VPISPAHDTAVLADIERALIRIRRRQSRRSLGRTALRELPGQIADLQQIAVVDAVEEGSAEADGCVTVGLVAERLAIDPSRASRLVSATIQSGFIRRTASQLDGRRICLELTELGTTVIERAHQSRQALYRQMLDGWPARDRSDLARLLNKFVDAMDEAQERA
jgi:DNA-binding MarR family transcriptional regulator